MDSFLRFGVLLTALRSRIEALWLFYSASLAKIDELASLTWYDPKLDRLSNKLRMKELGGSIHSYRQLLTELVIVGLAKTSEEIANEVDELCGGRFDIWKDDHPNLRYHSDAKYIRALNNCVKHSGGRIVNDGQPSNDYLIQQCGLQEGIEVWMLALKDLDIRHHIFKCYSFLLHLICLKAGITDPLKDVDEREAFEDFKGEILPSVIRV